MTSDIERAKRIADEIRPFWPEKADEIERAIVSAQSGQRDGVKVKVGIRYKLQKFDGEFIPGKTPIETIEGEG